MFVPLFAAAGARFGLAWEVGGRFGAAVPPCSAAGRPAAGCSVPAGVARRSAGPDQGGPGAAGSSATDFGWSWRCSSWWTAPCSRRPSWGDWAWWGWRSGTEGACKGWKAKTVEVQEPVEQENQGDSSTDLSDTVFAWLDDPPENNTVFQNGPIADVSQVESMSI